MNENNLFSITGIDTNALFPPILPPISLFGSNSKSGVNMPRNGKKKAPLIPDGLSVKEYMELAEKYAKENADLKSHKRFGLVWENIPDEQVDKLQKEIPVLIEDTDKAVVTNENDVNHILINGDNFHALTALRSSHLGKVDVIYIDPPYNTGNKDFIYNDNYVDKEDGYYHSKWLSFMEKRLILAKELLSDTGVIFVSIDDNEQARLKLLMDDIFGLENAINQFVWVNNLKGRQISNRGAAKTYEYILAYSKRIETINSFNISSEYAQKLMPSSYGNKKYEIKKDTIGNYVIKNELHNTNSIFNEETRPNLVYNIHYNPVTGEVEFSDIVEDKEIEGFVKIPPYKNNNGKHKYHAWRWSKKKVMEETIDLDFVKTKNSYKVFTKIRDFNSTYAKDIITNIGSGDISPIMGRSIFNYPKPVKLLNLLFSISSNPNAIVLDFFAGSGTTAHAVAELNKEDGGNRQCILITDGGKTETVGQSAKNAKTSTVNIAEEITYERVKRVLTGQNWADGKEHEPLGGNLRYFKIEMKNVEDLTNDDQKGLFQHHLINHAMIAENTFIKVLSKQDNLDSLYPQAYTVLTNNDNSKYLVVIKAHDHKLNELKTFLNTLDPDTEVILMGERIDKINWVKNNKGEYRIDTLLDKMIENRLSILNSSVFN